MACHVAENQPLAALRAHLSLPPQCHSFRHRCRRGHQNPVGRVGTMAAPGAALGYCQALFHYKGEPDLHTTYMMDLLKEFGAPWWGSHELFWGHRRKTDSIQDHLDSALAPLLGSGRVPVVITGLDPATDTNEIYEILAARPAVVRGETILLRLVLATEESLRLAGRLVADLVFKAGKDQSMPLWWPLFQPIHGGFNWELLPLAFGDNWRFVNLAVNPFVSVEELEPVQEQVTVAQIPIGRFEDIHNDGTIRISEGMRISGALPGAQWNLMDYSARFSGKSQAPTLIVLGPSLPSWTESDNLRRIERLLTILEPACRRLWEGMTSAKATELLRLCA